MSDILKLDEHWYTTENGNRWRFDPANPHIRWMVVYCVKSAEVHEYPTAFEKDGWHWYSVDTITHQRTSSLSGPFTSQLAAIADCETAHK